MITNPKILIVPGLGGSGANHWQTYWSKKFKNSLKLSQDNWDEPTLSIWLKKLHNTITELNTPTIIVGHSLAVSLIMHWAKNYSNTNIKGALLVAPADVDSPSHTPDVVRNFAPMPISKPPFPSIVIASENDPYISIERAQYFAKEWGSTFINIGEKGHINSHSNLTYWEEGQAQLQQLINDINLLSK